MDQTVERPAPSVGAPAPSKPSAPSPRLNEVIRRVKMELVSGRVALHERGAGFNPYDNGSVRDVWGHRRRA